MVLNSKPMKKIRKNVAGIDIGARHVFVGIESNKVNNLGASPEALFTKIFQADD